MKKHHENRIQPIEKPWIYEKSINPWLFHALKQSPYGDFGTLTLLNPRRTIRFTAVSVPLRGFWYADFFPSPNKKAPYIEEFQSPYGDFGTLTNLKLSAKALACCCFSPLTGILVRWLTMLLYLFRFVGRCFSPLTGILVRWPRIVLSTRSLIISFSPLTGILVRWLYPSVPAPWLGSQAIFSNLRLFWPFSGTRVKNKNQAVPSIRFVTPFVAILKIFKPTGFLTLK